MRNHSFKFVQPVLIVTVFGAVFWVNAHPLDLGPPPGAVVATGRFGTRVDVLTLGSTSSSIHQISQSGSYYLSENIIVQMGGIIIEIAANNVTLDLNGFSVSDTAVTSGGTGILVSGDYKNIAIRNGTISGFSIGVDAFNASNSRLQDLQAFDNRNEGLRLGSGTVSNCTSSENDGLGFFVGPGSTVIGCRASGNEGDGFSIGNGCTIIGCIARGNGSESAATGNGIAVGEGCTVDSCSATDNSGAGITALKGCTVTRCSARNNGTHGIAVGDDGTVSDCTATKNKDDGIRSGEFKVIEDPESEDDAFINGGTVTGCTASFNAGRQQNSDNPTGFENVGIRVGDGGTVTGCTASSNAEDPDVTALGHHGIHIGDGGTVTGCSVTDNRGDGIHAEKGSTIMGCSARNNSASGIDAKSGGNMIAACTVSINGDGISTHGNRNRIDGNHVTDNTCKGIVVPGFRNLIVNNSAGGNGDDYDIDICVGGCTVSFPQTCLELCGSLNFVCIADCIINENIENITPTLNQQGPPAFADGIPPPVWANFRL